MKPNTEQLESIKNILGSVTNYRETYAELYDHILTALEVLPDDILFAEALHRIVEIELGGKKGIIKIEAVYKKTAIKEIFKRYFSYFAKYLLSPFLLVGIALTIFLYGYMAKSPEWPGLLLLLTICMYINAIPLIVRKVLIFKAKRNGTYGKNSVISTAYGWFLAFPIYLFIALHIFPFLASLVVIQTFDSSMYTALGAFFLNTFNILALCRLCIDEINACNLIKT